MKGLGSPEGHRKGRVSIPLPGFIVMKANNLSGSVEAIVRFNPVAGIHCNES